MKRIVLFGNGAVASTLHYHLTRETEYRVAAFTVDRPFVHDNTFCGLPVVPWDEIVDRYPPSDFEMMIAIGFVQATQLRAQRYFEAKHKGYRLASYVSPKATLWDGFELGENCRIGANVMVQPYVRIGDNVSIGTGSLIGHHSVVDSHCHLSASVQIAGYVTVSAHCYIGINATIRNKVKIGPSCIIGAGAVILDDTVEKGVYMARAADLLPITSDKLSPV
jgi:sugar O-acyltransferase (sialic acid O-acetyltransferase NeuD family)